MPLDLEYVARPEALQRVEDINAAVERLQHAGRALEDAETSRKTAAAAPTEAAKAEHLQTVAQKQGVLDAGFRRYPAGVPATLRYLTDQRDTLQERLGQRDGFRLVGEEGGGRGVGTAHVPRQLGPLFSSLAPGPVRP